MHNLLCPFVGVYERVRERERTLDWCVEVKIYICVHVRKNENKKTDNKFTAAKIQCINTQPSVHKYTFMVRTLCVLLMLCIAEALSLMFHLLTAHA